MTEQSIRELINDNRIDNNQLADMLVELRKKTFIKGVKTGMYIGLIITVIIFKILQLIL